MGQIGKSVISPELTLESPRKWVSGGKTFSNLEDYVNGLQDEMNKIEAFKKELPLCMILVKDEVARLKKKMIVSDNNCKDEKNCDCDKMKWMSSVQLWSSGNQILHSKDKRIEGRRSELISAPFCKLKEETPLLCLGVSETKSSGLSPKSSSTRSVASSATDSKLNPKTKTQQAARKQRRSWSSELHRRFINALQQLGGVQAATPKQIRELMQFDGLTNDEVKSHLQKYRIHTRRASTTAVFQGSAMHKQKNKIEDDCDEEDSSEIHNQ